MLAAEIDLEERVVAALGTQDVANLLRVYGERDRFAFAAVQTRPELCRSGGDGGLRFCRGSRGSLLRLRFLLEPSCFPFVKCENRWCCKLAEMGRSMLRPYKILHAHNNALVLAGRSEPRPYKVVLDAK